MPEALRNILNRIREWWQKFTTRQKTIIIGLSLVAIVVFIVIIVVATRPKYSVLMTTESTAESSQVIDILTDAGIEYKTSSNALIISVSEADMPAAELAIGAAGYRPDSYSIADAQNSSLSDTNYDRTKRYQLYDETRLANSIKTIAGVKGVKVNFHIPNDVGTLVSSKEEASAYIQLDTDVNFNSNNAVAVAKAVATFLGNDTTANITILNSDGVMLFTGGDDYTTAGIATSMQELQETAEAYMANKIKGYFFGTNQYQDVAVTSFLDMDYAAYEETVKEYYANADRTEGMLAHQETYESESENGVAGVPGTDSNGEGQTYVFENGSNSSASSSETLTDYLPNEKSRFTNSPAGVINHGKSSVSVALISYKELSEKDAKTMGLLDGITWNEYKLANGADKKLEVDQDLYEAVAHASGIPVENISIVAYESPVFHDKEALKINWTTVLSAVLFVLILVLLIVVVLRSMATKKEEQTQEEVSVETLLQSTPEPAIEDIDVETKSETRKMVEKFVDENPEAAAALLRNWLNDDWS